MEKCTASDTSGDRQTERRNFYDQGLDDKDIARCEGVTRSAVYHWRVRNDLPRHTPEAIPSSRQHLFIVGEKTSLEEDAARRRLHADQLNDRQIAQQVGVTANAIYRWRKSCNLAPNLPCGRNTRASVDLYPVTPDLKRRALALLERGIGARLIAREMKASRQTVDRWRTEMLRERPGLRRPAGAGMTASRALSSNPRIKMTSERRARAFVLYADGLNDTGIAKDLGVRRQHVSIWRNALSLPALKRMRAAKPKPKPFAAAITPRSNPLYARLYDAIGRGIASDVRDDAISELWLAIEEGKVDVANLVSAAKRFRNRAVSDYANPYGPRSLDEGIGDGDGFRMIDLIRDEQSSSWLEDAGATVW